MDNPLVAWAVITFAIATGMQITQRPEDLRSKVAMAIVAIILLGTVISYFLRLARILG
jgi:hypothetical protein